jgi:PTH1 family peptidyl-tRNA hydrolase
MNVTVGLGNPGRDYESTRHNIGFRVIDRLAASLQITSWENKFDAQVARGSLEGRRFMLVKPQTYMNKSGWAVRAAMQYYKVPLVQLLVILDDMDLEVGKVRARGKGSDGGHRGLRSVIECMGSQEFKRLRLGVGRPTPGESVIARVLNRVRAPKESGQLDTAVEEAARLAVAFIANDEFENWTSP